MSSDPGQSKASDNMAAGCSPLPVCRQTQLSESGTEVRGADSSDVCRDFLRDKCSRGTSCRFRHPVGSHDNNPDSATFNRLVFCHDFQNPGGCHRGLMCRFVHCTRQEEVTYRRTGLLPIHAYRKLAINMAATRYFCNSDKPVCIDFLKPTGCR